MSTLQLLSGLLLNGILASLVTGLCCYLLLQVLLRLFPKGGASVTFFLCNACLLLTTLAFLRPFLREASFYAQRGLIPPALPLATSGIRSPLSTQPVYPGLSLVSGNNALSDLLTGYQHMLQEQAHLIGMVYICGLFFFLTRLIAGYYQMQRLRTQGICAPTELWKTQMTAALGTLGIGQRIGIAFSCRVTAPCIIGRAKAIVLIPLALAARLTPAQVEAVLLHELAHYKQYHYYINMIVQAMATLQFFNPFVWLLLRASTRYREYACDALARRYSRQIELAESLLIIAEQQQYTRSAFLLSLHSSRNHLLHRIQHLLFMKPVTAPSRTTLVAALVAMIIACCCYGSLRALPSKRNDANTDTLAVISRQLQADTNLNFLIVEALRDSLIRFNTPYHMAYEGGAVSIDRRLLPEPFQSKYRALIAEHNRRFEPGAKGYAWSVETDKGLSLDQVLDPSSRFRKSVFRMLTRNKSDQPVAAPVAPIGRTGNESPTPKSDNGKAIYEQMIADGLIKGHEPIHVVYQDGILTVNDQVLTGILRRKYKDLLRDNIDFAQVKPGKPAKYSYYAQSVIKPPIRNGNSLIQFPRRPEMKPYIYALPALPAGLEVSPYEVLAGSIAADDLADTSFAVHVVYTVKGIFVNDKILDAEKQARYEQLLMRSFSYGRPRQEKEILDITF